MSVDNRFHFCSFSAVPTPIFASKYSFRFFGFRDYKKQPHTNTRKKLWGVQKRSDKTMMGVTKRSLRKTSDGRKSSKECHPHPYFVTSFLQPPPFSCRLFLATPLFFCHLFSATSFSHFFIFGSKQATSKQNFSSGGVAEMGWRK